MSSVASESLAVSDIKAAVESASEYLEKILEKTSYIEARLDESQGRTSDLFRHLQQSLENFDSELGGAVGFEKEIHGLFESFTKNCLLQGLSGSEKLNEFKVLVKAAQMEAFESVCWKKFQHLLDIRLLEMKMEASVDEGLEQVLEEKNRAYKKLLKTCDFTLQNCFRPELLGFVQEVKVIQEHWSFESRGKFALVVAHSRFKNFMAYLQHWFDKKVLSIEDVKDILSKPDAVEPLKDYVQPAAQVLQPPFERMLSDVFENSVISQ